jgi:hypothetical protein
MDGSLEEGQLVSGNLKYYVTIVYNTQSDTHFGARNLDNLREI